MDLHRKRTCRSQRSPLGVAGLRAKRAMRCSITKSVHAKQLYSLADGAHYRDVLDVVYSDSDVRTQAV